MRGPVPCAWELQAATSQLLAFGSYRGAFKLVDAATGMGLPLALPPGAYPDGGSPGGFFRCEGGICLSYAMPSGDTASSAVRFAGGLVSLGPAPTRRESRWCAHVGLPVPREVCDATGDP
ncbi:MAG: hypothetical protein BGO98_36150 [Myxococcales bacterium 68-20]|nr:hypothetical protein [Myxococcales bacterium]OJY26020.1 MAG: hypothetical protein BGO98_36150 [Myxococcales bacterium 68-20]